MSIKAKNETISRAMSLDGDVGKLADHYDGWSDRYDQDVLAEGYLAHRVVADIVIGFRNDRNVKILDAGCGTGLAGARLSELGYGNLFGFDLSAEMVLLARARSCYLGVRDGIDLNKPLDDLDNDFDLVLSCGVYTLGHVPPSTIVNLLAVCKPGGLVIISTRHSYVASSGFDTFLARLEREGQLRIAACYENRPYTSEESASYWVLERP